MFPQWVHWVNPSGTYDSWMLTWRGNQVIRQVRSKWMRSVLNGGLQDDGLDAGKEIQDHCRCNWPRLIRCHESVMLHVWRGTAEKLQRLWLMFVAVLKVPLLYIRSFSLSYRTGLMHQDVRPSGLFYSDSLSRWRCAPHERCNSEVGLSTPFCKSSVILVLSIPWECLCSETLFSTWRY